MNYRTMKTATIGALCATAAMCDPVHAHEPGECTATAITENGRHAVEVISFQARARVYNLETPYDLETKRYIGQVGAINPRLISGAVK